MKNNQYDYFLLAHVDLDKVQYNKGVDLGIEFRNEIDAWDKIAFKFRGNRWTEKFAPRDLHPLIYSVRTRFE